MYNCRTSAMLRRDRITIEQCISALKSYQQIPIQFLYINLKEALNIVNQFKLYAYDAYLLAVAQHTNHPLISLDNQLLKIAKEMNIKVYEVTL